MLERHENHLRHNGAMEHVLIPETMTPLTLAVLVYHHTGNGLKEIQDMILIMAYRYPMCTKMIPDDEAGDFLLFFTPRIKFIITEFSFQGYSFETYLKSCIRWRVRSYHQIQKRHHARELSFIHNVLHTTHYEESYELFDDDLGHCVAEHDPTYLTDDLYKRSDFQKKLGSESDRRRLLLIALQSARFVDDTLVGKLAEFCKKPAHELLALFDRVWDLQSQCWEQLDFYRSKRDRLYADLLECHMQTAIAVDQDERITLRSVELDLLARLELTRETIAYLERGVPQATLARIVGVPKGTVNSGFFYIRRKLDKYLARTQFS